MKKFILAIAIFGLVRAEYSEFYKNASLFLQVLGNFKYEITPQGLKALINSGSNSFVIIDLRSENAYRRGHIRGAVNIPYKKLFSPENINRLPKDKKIIVYCPDESISPYVVALLRGAGFDAWQLKGGYRSWTGGVSQKPVEVKKEVKVKPERIAPQPPPPEPEEEEEEEGC